MWRRLIALVLSLAVPVGASGGPLKEAAEKGGRELAAAQQEGAARSRGRVWTGVALIAGGGVLAVLGGLELGEDDSAPDDDGDIDDADDAEDSDGWGNKAMLGGGIAAATVGAFLLIRGGTSKSGPVVSVRPGRAMVRHTIRF